MKDHGRYSYELACQSDISEWQIAKSFDIYPSDISHSNGPIISENYRYHVPIRGIKIVAPKILERWKLSHWWEPSLKFEVSTEDSEN